MATVAQTNGQAVNSAAGAVVQNTSPVTGVEQAAKKASDKLNKFFGSKLDKENAARVEVRQFVAKLADSGLSRNEAFEVVSAGFANLGQVIGEDKLFQFVDSDVAAGRTLRGTLDGMFNDAVNAVYAGRVEPVVESRFTALKVVGLVLAASVLALSVYGIVAGPDAVLALGPKALEVARNGANFVAANTPECVVTAYNTTKSFVSEKAEKGVELGSAFISGSKETIIQKGTTVVEFLGNQGSKAVEAGKGFLAANPNAPLYAAGSVAAVGIGIVGGKLVQDYRTSQRIAQQPTTGDTLDVRTRAALAQADASLNTAGMSKEQVASVAQKKLASLEESLVNLKATRADAKKGKDVLTKEAVKKLNEAIKEVEKAISSLQKVVKQNGTKPSKN
jgi:hypothetical protein